MPYEVANIEQSAQFVVQDLRPKTEKEHKSFSLLITSKAYGIIRVGEAETGLNPIRLFQHRVYEKLGANSEKLDVKVHHLVTYFNHRSSTKKAALGAAIGGVVGALVADSGETNTPLPEGVSHVDREVFESNIKDEYLRGYYTEMENPDNSDIVIVYLDAEINGKRKFLRRISKFDNGEKVRWLIEDTDKITQAFLAEY